MEFMDYLSHAKISKPLSAREMQILALVAKGHTNTGIAARLSLANATVRTHLTNIFRKLGVHRRTEAAVKYLGFNTEQMIAPAIDHILNNLNEPLRISTLSKMTGFSGSHFFVLFKSVTGCSPMNFIIRLRMQRACHLLQTRRLKIKEIGERVGYGDPYHFSRIFKSFVGVAPHEYRNTISGPSLKKSKPGPGHFHAKTTRFSLAPQFMPSRTTFKRRMDPDRLPAVSAAASALRHCCTEQEIPIA